MTKSEILNYLFLTNFKDEKAVQKTRVVMKNKESNREVVSFVFFLKSNQNAALINENKWVFQAIDIPYDCFVVDGHDVLHLLQGRAFRNNLNQAI